MTPIRHSQYSHLPPSDCLHVQVSSCPPTMLFNPCHGGSHGRGDQHNHRPQLEFCGSTHDGNVWASPPTTVNEKSTRERHLISNRDSSKWTPCKMRFMRRRVNSNALAATNPRTIQLKLQDQQQAIAEGNTSSSSNDNHSHHHGVPNCVVRVCSDCNTTKTPLWRSGPRGPKSLCNACGIRRIRKTRRAMTATALTSGFIPAAAPAAQERKEKGPDSEPCKVPFKKRCKFDHSTQGKLQLEDFATSLNKNQAFKRVFPQDEREAAVLLMALSGGLIHG